MFGILIKKENIKMGITGIDCEGSLEVGSSRMKITGVNYEGSIKNKEDKVILDSDISDEEFLEAISKK